MASCKILVSAHFKGRRCHFIHQFTTNKSQSFKTDFTVALILKHYEQARRIRKVLFVKKLRKLRTLAMMYALN